MNQTEILSQITDVFREILDEDALVLEASTTAQDVEDWDSLTHIVLVVGIEERFKIKFGSKEILAWKNVGEMCASVSEKL